MTITSTQPLPHGHVVAQAGKDDHSRLLLVAESVVLLGVPGLSSWLGWMDFEQWPLHPFLYVTILLAAQYGIEGAVLAVLGGTLLSWLSGWPERPLGVGYQDFFLTLWLQPLTWLSAGLLIGIVTSSRTRLLREKADQLAQSRTAEILISSQFEILAERNRKLERTLAGLEDGPQVAVGQPKPQPRTPKIGGLRRRPAQRQLPDTS